MYKPIFICFFLGFLLNPFVVPAFATPPITGTFGPIIDYSSANDVAADFAQYQASGLDTLITSAVKQTYNNCLIDWAYADWSAANNQDRSQNHATTIQKYNWLFDQADAHQIKIYVGLLWSPECSGDDFEAEAIAANRQTVAEFLNHWGNRPSFAGWYTGDEPYVYHGGPYDHFTNLRQAMRNQSQALGLTPKPMLTSPYIIGRLVAGNDFLNPNQLAQKIESFVDETSMDIIVVQDGVGASNVPVFSTTDSRSSDFFQAIHALLPKEKVWADLEFFTYCSPSPDCWQQPWGETYTSSSMTRIQTQINHTPDNFVSKRIMYNKRFNFYPHYHDPQLSPSANRLYDAYFATYLNTDQMLQPQSYSYQTQPDLQYPDTNNQELFNHQIADPDTITHPDWVGILGSTTITLNFNQNQAIGWVGAHVLNHNQATIYFPQSISLSCQTQPQGTWTTLGTWNRPIARNDREYVIQNTTKLTSANNCRALKLTLNNDAGAWTFLDEIEIIGQNAILGDIDGDNDIDFSDQSAIKTNINSPSCNNPTDHNADCQVNILDYSLVVSHFGQS